MPAAAVETRSVTLEDLKRGVELRTGRNVTLRVSGASKLRDHFIHHTFVSPGGEGVAGVAWRIVKDGREVSRGRTGEDGHVAAKVPDAGDYHLELVEEAPAAGGPHPETVEHEPEAQEVE